MQNWLDNIEITFKILGKSEFEERKNEVISIRSLSRGAYAKDDIKKGSKINSSDIYYAFPVLKESQHTSSSISFPSTALDDIKKHDSLIESINVQSPEIKPKYYLKSAIHEIKALLSIGSIHLNSTFSLELSHHKGPKNFKKLVQQLLIVLTENIVRRFLYNSLINCIHFTSTLEKRKPFKFYLEVEIVSDGHKYLLNEGEP